jgi:hypothetical protein
MKKIIVLFMSIVVTVVFSVSPAFAGSKQRHRWQGVAIGAGAVILGSALAHNKRECRPPARVIYYHTPARCYSPRYPYDQAYEQEYRRLQRQDQLRWEHEQRLRGRDDARDDYYRRR